MGSRKIVSNTWIAARNCSGNDTKTAMAQNKFTTASPTALTLPDSAAVMEPFVTSPPSPIYPHVATIKYATTTVSIAFPSTRPYLSGRLTEFSTGSTKQMPSKANATFPVNNAMPDHSNAFLSPTAAAPWASLGPRRMRTRSTPEKRQMFPATERTARPLIDRISVRRNATGYITPTSRIKLARVPKNPNPKHSCSTVLTFVLTKSKYTTHVPNCKQQTPISTIRLNRGPTALSATWL
mmetsp:Transcript_45480/g.120103  ORF Transcript_45480/g.120103 Transcript_45480/m.120103 type:complete len:238 (+) Transcript_45480:312-1025(+)